MEICKGIPGLKQAGRITNDRLTTHLAQYGYSPVPRTPSLWSHSTRPIQFALVVDDFGVKHFSKADAQHLIDAVKSHYDLTIDWSGSPCCGLTLDWHYDEGYVDVSMPGYVERALQKFNHPAPLRAQHAPHQWNAPAYGSRQPQNPTPLSKAPLLDKHGTVRIQSISGTFLYYGRACNPCILPDLNEIASEQAKPTTDTIPKTDMLMDYLHTYPNAVIRYHASGMILKITSNTASIGQPTSLCPSALPDHHRWLTINLA